MGAELVAREAEDDELVGVRGVDGFVDFFEAFVLGCEAAFGGSVDD